MMSLRKMPFQARASTCSIEVSGGRQARPPAQLRTSVMDMGVWPLPSVSLGPLSLYFPLQECERCWGAGHSLELPAA